MINLIFPVLQEKRCQKLSKSGKGVSSDSRFAFDEVNLSQLLSTWVVYDLNCTSRISHEWLNSIKRWPWIRYLSILHIMDLEGNKIELWEPIDSFFTNMAGATTK